MSYFVLEISKWGLVLSGNSAKISDNFLFLFKVVTIDSSAHDAISGDKLLNISAILGNY